LAKKKKLPEGDILLSESQVQQVWDFYKFANSMNPILNPMLVNERLKEVTMNPLAATQDGLDAALASPKESELALQGYSESFEILSQPYKRLLSYLGLMLSWDLTYTCTNATKDDYKSPAYGKDLKILESFLDRFDYEKEFTTVIKEMLRNETYFCLPRFDGDKIVLQEFPSSPTYTKITGRWEYGMLWSANMMWFILPGVDLNMYPNFFARKYNELWGSESKNKGYIPSLSPELRGSSSWIYWQDIPVDIGWCWKLSTELATRLPYFTGLFSDLILQGTMRNLQKNINMAAASKILVGSVPFLKDTGAKVKDSLSMSPETLGKFLALVKSALSEAIKVSAAPLENMSGVEFSSDNEVYPAYLRNMLATSGINTNLIFTSDVRPNQLESQLSLNADEQLMTALYPQFNSFMEYQVNKLTKKFKWKFNFEGTRFFTNRAERFQTQTSLMGQGIVLPQKIAAAVGIRPTELRRMMEEADAMGFVEKLTPIVLAAQMPADGGGRPKTPDNKLGDAGAETRESGANLGRGGKV